MEDKFSCVIIGEGALPQKCAELLQQQGFQIVAVFSPNTEFEVWCRRYNIRYASSLNKELDLDFFSKHSFDYLFSLNNRWIIKPWLLSQPQRLAINYHNAPLPLYGGVHATSWAIYNAEKTHGITLHVITDAIDAGDILAQEIIPIDSSDTAVSLNMRCQEILLSNLFCQLIEKIKTNQLNRIAQSLSHSLSSTFHYLKDKIDPIINWQQSAIEIQKMYRALNTGNHMNWLGVPQFVYRNEVFFVKNIRIYSEKIPFSTTTPGEIVAVLNDCLIVASQKGLLAISKLIDSSGQKYEPREFMQSHALSVGVTFPIFSEETRKSLLHYRSTHYRDEFFWESQLRSIQAKLTLPFQDLPANKKLNSSSILDGTHSEFSIFQNGTESRYFLTVSFLLYLARVNQLQHFSIGIVADPKRYPQNSVITRIVPLSLEIDFLKPYADVSVACWKLLEKIQNTAPYFLDLPQRIVDFDFNVLHFSLIIDHFESHLPSSFSPCILNINNGKIYLRYQPDYVANTFVESLPYLASSFQSFLFSLQAHAADSLQSLPLLSQKETKHIVVDSNIERQQAYPNLVPMMVHHLFEQQVKRTPSATALILGGEVMNYLELNNTADCLAAVLRKYRPQLITKEFLVPLCVDRSFDMIIGILAILKAGGAYVPIDPDYPQERISQILTDTQSPILLTVSSANKKFDFFLDKLSCVIYADLYRKKALTENEAKSSTDDFMYPHRLAYVIYTSGTTGNPKGVMMEHRSLVNRLHWMKARYEMSIEERFLHKTPFVFDWSFSEIFLPLISGASLIIAKPQGHKDATYLHKLLLENKIQYVHFVPSMLLAFLAHVRSAKENYFPDLKRLFLSGENVTQEMICQTKNIFSGAIENLYGPTEGGEVSYHDCQAVLNPNVPIGYPIANSELYVLGSQQEPLPVGTVGKLYIGGAVVARGYWNDPVKTQQRFLHNPLKKEYPQLAEILYDTGDLARRLPDGAIDFLGRTDEQVKIRGMRVELAGIEAVLREHDAIRHAVVATFRDTLVAYVVAHDAKIVEHTAIKKFLSARLPTYMVPTALLVLEELPITHNGKIDRKALPQPKRSQLLREVSYHAPTTPIQQQLVTMWEEVLGIKTSSQESIGITDSFYDLGGNSIATTYLFSKINTQYHLSVVLRDFLQNPTIEYLHSVITGAPTEKKGDDFFSQDLNISFEDIQFLVEPVLHWDESILLTGATGFLGASLLYQLLIKTKADVYCLVRAVNLQIAIDKLSYNFSKYYPYDSIQNNQRVKIILGDLSQPCLGMSSENWSNFASIIDTIYHNGAFVHHLYNYNTLRATNVLSTLELIRFANQKRPKHFYYISTLSAAKKDSGGYATEQLPALEDNAPENFSGYVQTKWMSERLLSAASQKGASVIVFRLGWITGKRDSGAFAINNDHLGRLIKACIQMQFAPNLDIALGMVPVDFLSQLIVSLSLQARPFGQAFNLSNTNLISWQSLTNWIQNYGYPMKIIPYEEWSTLLAQADESNALFPLLPLYNTSTPSIREMNHQMWSSNNSNVIDFLSKNNLNYPIVDQELLSKYFQFFHQCGFIERPPVDQTVSARQNSKFMLFSKQHLDNSCVYNEKYQMS